MIDCARFSPWRWEYLDAELDPAARAAFELHLAVCRRCLHARQIDGAFLDLLARQSRRAAPPALRARVRELATRL
jgi:anti-sigma factor (TIGR02949 family)